MKRLFLFVSCMIIVLESTFAYYESSDFSNYPNVSIDLKPYSSNDAPTILRTLVGDTISLTYNFTMYGTKRLDFELLAPDTIWVKNAKKPQLNKHYYLCYAYNGKRVDYEKYADGSPFFRNESFENVIFVLNNILDNDELGRTCIQLNELSTKRTIIWHIENEVTLRDLTLENKINNYVIANPLYYEQKNKDKTYIQQSTFVNAIFEFTFYSSEYSYPNTFKVNLRSNKSKIQVSVKEDAESEEKLVSLNLSSGFRTAAPYKFVTKDDYIEQQQQYTSDISLDDSFFLPITIDGYIYDLTAQESVDISKKTGYIYAAEKHYGSYRYYLYCQGRKMRLDYYDVGKVDPDKLAFLQRRGNEGVELREATAIQKDKEQQLKDKQKATAYAQKIAQQKDEFVNKNIFLTKAALVSTKYQCGIDLNIFNCYNKTIKYIDFTVASFNHFNDPQKDEIGVGQKSAQCIGPIDPKHSGRFVFDELFWDKNSIITSCRLTYIKITFTDNTSVSFSGWGNIKTHYKEANF